MDKKKVFIVGNQPGFSDFIHNVVETTKIEEAELLIFRGGADINPELYGEKEGNFTHIDIQKDAYEIAHFQYALENNIPMLGICRGGQLLTVLSGGSLIQHVTNHSQEHVVTDINKDSYMMSSSHHQMFYPFDMNPKDYKLIAWTKYNRSNTYLDGDNKRHKFDGTKQVEPEVVWYPNTKCLAIQGHPEWIKHLTHTINIVNKYIDTYIWKSQQKKEKQVQQIITV